MIFKTNIANLFQEMKPKKNLNGNTKPERRFRELGKIAEGNPELENIYNRYESQYNALPKTKYAN